MWYRTLEGTDAANQGNVLCSISHRRLVDATAAPLLAGSRPGLHLVQPAYFSPTMLPPLRVVLQREVLPQRRALLLKRYDQDAQASLWRRSSLLDRLERLTPKAPPQVQAELQRFRPLREQEL